MKDEAQREADNTFANLGWTKAGGMWGDAQWKLIAPGFAASIGGGVAKDSTIQTDDFARAPVDLSFPCQLIVYSVDDPAWNASVGEAPSADHFHSVVFSSPTVAIGLLDFIAKHLPPLLAANTKASEIKVRSVSTSGDVGPWIGMTWEEFESTNDPDDAAIAKRDIARLGYAFIGGGSSPLIEVRPYKKP